MVDRSLSAGSRRIAPLTCILTMSLSRLTYDPIIFTTTTTTTTTAAAAAAASPPHPRIKPSAASQPRFYAQSSL